MQEEKNDTDGGKEVSSNEQTNWQMYGVNNVEKK
jgi:hypothetical protein